ncbi:MAG TPA: hypothetical protein VFZ10_13870 [Geminicoccaceae bacterium]
MKIILVIAAAVVLLLWRAASRVLTAVELEPGRGRATGAIASAAVGRRD